MKTRENELLFISVVVDLLLLNGMLLLLYFGVFQAYSFGDPDLLFPFLALNVARIASYFIIRKHIIYPKKGFRPRFVRMLQRSGAFLLLLIVLFFFFDNQLSGATYALVISTALLFLISKFSFNYFYYSMVKERISYSNRVRKVLLLGENEVMSSVRDIINFNPALNFRYVGSYPTTETTDCQAAYDELSERVLHEGLQVMFIAVDRIDDEQAGCWNLRELLLHCNRWGVRLYYVPTVKPEKTDDIKFDQINGHIIYNPQRIPLDLAENQIKKRLFDIAFSGFVVIFILSWLYPIIALIIKLNSRGPVLFIQPRTGINNRTFQCYKFRSMRLNGESHKRQATKDDPRITAVGRFLRRTNLDELPQFMNVLWGDMSVVGPRPHMLAHTELFSREVHNYLVRHYVKPGLTGWAQVNGFRGETKELWQIEKRVQFDHEYIRNWTFDWDFVIVWKTIFSLKAFKNAG